MNFSLELDNTNGENVFFKDITISPDYSIVKQTRFLCGNYPDEEVTTTLTEGQELDIYRQYQKTSTGDSIYDGKTIPSGGFFIPFVSGLIVQTGDIFQTNGYYSLYVDPNTYLPDVTQNVFIMNTGYWGGFSSVVFPDRVYDLQYETYQDTTPSTLTNVTNEVQYIVYGTGSSTALYNGNTYRVGEVFIAIDDTAVSFTGDATLKELIGSKQKYYTFIFGINNTLTTYIANQQCGCGYTPVLGKVMLEIYALNFSNFTQWVSASKATETISWITDQLIIAINANL